ncbi:alkyl hydroperoxide reductase subunit F [Arcanobacterium phocisimile]|uniref:Alkyl hydroperoxide reductase subunit F n=1 Tax=Arcanobacterium phocisimile TaxID=1302235 RepID=A0ABX7IFN6_9ACTO|nr:alkyl hydroperoxide reductase subunit F [Arcanobacterium phocisimile]QRV01786.1 alkyl hydroperoxide reductase subunit F [Arcanobacterium phocisimile]
MFLDSNTISQLKGLVSNIQVPIRFEASLDGTKRSEQMREMLTQVAELSPLIEFVEVPDRRTPSFAISRVDSEVSVRIAGLPMGEEFSSFVLAMVQVGGHPVRADEDVIEAIKALDEPHEFVTYMSLTCQNCPTVVQALNAMSVINPLIKHTAVEGGAFQNEIDEHGIKAVPTVFMDGEIFGQGRMSLAEIVAKLDTNSGAKRAEKLNSVEPFDMLIVGGGPAGASAAVYAARKGLRVGVATHNVGGQVLDTASIENLTVLEKIGGTELGSELNQSMTNYGVEVITGLTARALHNKDENSLFAVDFEGDITLRARSVVVATGARYRTTGVPGEDQYRNHGVSFCPHCDGPLFKGQSVAVIGGGNSAIEAAIDLAGICSDVTVIEMMPELKADEVLLDKLASLPNTSVVTSAALQEVHGDGTDMTGLSYRDVDGEIHTVDANGMFVQIGLVPNSEWLDGVLDLNRGAVAIDSQNATSMPGVFAAGDVTDIPYKQVLISLGAGANASLGAFDYLIRH